MSERATGMMWRTEMPVNAGCVPSRGPVPALLLDANTLPLSIAFIADDGTVVRPADMEPRLTKEHCAGRRCATPRDEPGLVAAGIKPGSRPQGGPFPS